MKCIINASEFKIKYNYPIALYTLLELQANKNVIKKSNYNIIQHSMQEHIHEHILQHDNDEG